MLTQFVDSVEAGVPDYPKPAGKALPVGVESHLTPMSSPFAEARRHPRFKLESEIRVYPRNSAVVRGHTVDISESGISAMLRTEIPVGEVVRLEFALPLGEIEVFALVRQRNAFRFGFQFVDSGANQDILERTCRQLAVEESLKPTGPGNFA